MIMYKRFRGLWVCVMLCLLLPTMALAAGSVAIDSSHFPDNSFREIVDTFDLNGDRVLSETELEKVTSIDCNNKGISSLKGIEYFTKLEELNCSGNQLTDLDVSSNGAMMRLYCSNNNVTTLDVSRNPVLVTLDCSNNKLTALDVSCNANLQYFYCENNQLTSLDVSNHTVLASLDCDSNRLTQLNVKNCTKLSNLSCADNQLTALDVSDNTALVTLDCYNNDLTVLDVSSHSNLATLGCGKNQLTSLYLDNTSVSYLAGADNQYSILVGTDSTYALDRLPGSFDATKASSWVGGTVADGVLMVNKGADQVTYDYDCGRGFTQSFTLTVTVLDNIPIDEAHFPDANFRTFVAQYDTDRNGVLSEAELKAVTSIRCDNQEIGSLKGIEYFAALETLSCGDNQLETLDVSRNARIWLLYCEDNQLTALNLSSNTVLSSLDCSGNQLTALDVSSNTKLKSLDCSGNLLTTLDVSSNAALSSLNCSGNQLTALDVSSNAVLSSLKCSGNLLATLNVGSHTALQSLQCSGNQLETLDVSQNTALHTLVCSHNQLTTLNLRQNTQLVHLDCTYNQLTSLDVSGHEKLDFILCKNNRLATLNVENCTALMTLDCGNNALTELDVSSNTSLAALVCRTNQLAALNVTQNTQLTDLDFQGNQLTSLDLSQTNMASLNGKDNRYAIIVGIDRTFTLSELPGSFDVTKASSWVGGTVADGVLKVNEGANQVTYDYDCGKGFTQSFTLTVTVLDNIPIDAAHFPDANFRTFVAQYDTDQNGAFSWEELAVVTSIRCDSLGIANLQGIEYFTNLEELNCNYNKLTKLDIHHNGALKRLSCDGNKLITLDLRGNIRLQELSCNDNQLVSLNISTNSQLFSVTCFRNQLMELSVIGNPVLTTLVCWENQLTELDVSSNHELVTLDCAINQLTVLDVSNNPALEELGCSDNQLATLDVSHNPALVGLGCGHNQLKKLDVSLNTALERLGCSYNQLTELDVSHNQALVVLYCGFNQLKKLDVSLNTALEELDCPYNQLTELDVSHNPALEELGCSNNQLTELNVSRNSALTWLSCSYNQLKHLDVSNNPMLCFLFCQYNQLMELEVSNNTALGYLDCNNNRLTAIDVRSNPSLGSLYCDFNYLTSMDVSSNSLLTSLRSHGFSYEIKVGSDRAFDLSMLPGSFDAAKASNWVGGTVSDGVLTVNEDADQVTYTYDCGRGFTQSFTLTVTVLDGIPIDAAHFPDTNFRAFVAQYDTDQNGVLSEAELAAVTTIDCSEKDIASLKGIEYFTALTMLGCNGNQLKELDLRQNTQLTRLVCRQNDLTTLDVSNNTLLELLNCSDNQLTSLNLSQNTQLITLRCDNNQLITLDLSQNTKLRNLYCAKNKLKILDLSQISVFDDLNCSENELESLVLSQNAAVTHLYCNTNRLTALDVSGRQIVTLDCCDNHLTELNVSNTRELGSLYCSSNRLTALDVSGNAKLMSLDCSKNQLTVLDVSQNAKLQSLTCTDNLLTSLNLSQTNIGTVNSYYNKYTIRVGINRTFDLSGLPGDFDVTRASSWDGGRTDGNTLIVNQDTTAVEYTYDTGKGNVQFKLVIEELPHYTISYELDGGELPEDSTNPPLYDEVYGEIILVNPTKPGYTFAGWTGTDLAQATVDVTIPTGSMGDREYKATWTADSYTIGYDLAGGTLPEGKENPSSYTVESGAITLVNPTKPGYTFAGWTGTDLTQATVDVTIPAGSTGNRLYTAKWSIVQYTIMYDLDGGELEQGVTNPTSYTIETEDFWLHEPIKSNYGFIGWTGSNGDEPQRSVGLQKGSTGSLSFKANFTPDIYRIDLDTDGGVTADGSELPIQYSIESDDILLPLMVREGYEFLGWIGTGVEQPAKQVLILKGSVGDCSYKAKWQPIEYSIRYYLPDSAVHSGNPTSYTIESDDIVLNDARMTGYVFQGWLEDGKEQAAQKGLTIFKGSMGNRSFTAQFTEIEEKLPTIYVEYNNKGGSVTGAGSYDKHEQVRLEAKANEGWRFVCWRDSDNKIVHSEPVYTFLATKTLYLKAEFEKLPVSVNTRNEGLSEKHISEAMRRNGVETPEQIVRGMERVLAETGIMVDGMANYDITLQISYDYGQSWTDVTQENMPKEGIWFELTFPKGSDPRRHEYYVTHMFASGPNAGQIEMPEFKVTDTGISVHLTSLSPVSVSWRLKPSQEDLRDLPETGDNSRAGLWFALMLLAGIGVLVLRRKTA